MEEAYKGEKSDWMEDWNEMIEDRGE